MDNNNFTRLEAIIFTQLALEKNEALKDTPFYKGHFKQKVNDAIAYLEKGSIHDYNKAFAADEELSKIALWNIEKVVEFIKGYHINELIYLATVMEAHRLNPKSLEGIVKQIFKKANDV